MPAVGQGLDADGGPGAPSNDASPRTTESLEPGLSEMNLRGKRTSQLEGVDIAIASVVDIPYVPQDKLDSHVLQGDLHPSPLDRMETLQRKCQEALDEEISDPGAEQGPIRQRSRMPKRETGHSDLSKATGSPLSSNPRTPLSGADPLFAMTSQPTENEKKGQLHLHTTVQTSFGPERAPTANERSNN